MMTRYIYVARIIWLSLSVLILFFSLHKLSQLGSMRDVSELISVMTYGMVLISFPVGTISVIALFFIDFAIGFDIDNKYILITIVWFFLLSGGYIQWFLLIDRIIKKTRV